MEKLFVQQLDKQYARLDKERLERERLEKERQERLLAVVSSYIIYFMFKYFMLTTNHISQTLNTSIQQQLERIIKKELHTEMEKFSQNVVQSIEGAVLRTVTDAVKKTAQGPAPKVDQRTLDALFKEALDKAIPQMRYVNFPLFFFSLSSSFLLSPYIFGSGMIAESLRQPIQQSFVQYFQDKLIPAFDQSCKVMFAQLSSTFEEGVQGKLYILLITQILIYLFSFKI